jgi:RNA polymerase sigma-70 factor (ECF subfamily)
MGIDYAIRRFSASSTKLKSPGGRTFAEIGAWSDQRRMKQMAMTSAVAKGAAGDQRAFATTHWSVVLEAQGETPAAQRALEMLCRTYWRPIYSFVRQQNVGPEEAEDLTQAFFALLLERKGLDRARKEKGRLRSYLLVSLKNFLADERSRAMAIKRGRGQRVVSLEELRDKEGVNVEPADTLTADQIYERRWALTVLEQVLSRLEEEYRADKGELFERFEKLLANESGHPSQADIATQLGMSENAVKQAFHRFRQRYRSLFREAIAHTVAVPGDVEEELRHLIAVLRT